MVEKSLRPKARSQKIKESKPLAPEKSIRPKTREQVRIEDEMRQFGNLEFRADMEDQLSWNPLARLGFEPDQSVVGRPAYNSPRIYEGIRYPYDSEQEYIDETLPMAASGAEYRDIVGRVKPGSVVVNSNTAKNPVWSHEYTHGGLEKVIEYLNEDRDFFTEKYGEDTVRLLDEIRSDTNRSKGPNERLTEMLDDVSKDLEVDLEGNLIPAAGTALGKMDNTRTAVENWVASPTSKSVRSRRTLQEYLKMGRVKDEKLHKSDIESAFPGYVGIFEAAEDMLEAQGEPLPTEKRGWLKRTLSKMGFEEGGLATQTEEAFTNPSDRLMAQSDERKLGAGLTSLEFEADMMPLLKKDPIAMLGYKASMPNRRFPSIQKLTGNNTPLYYDVSENPIGPNYNPSSDKVGYGRDYGSSKDVILHELRHRGLKILDERYKEKDSFIADYGDMAHRLLDKAETSGTKSNEFVVELYDNPDATYIKPGGSGSKNTIGYVADSLQFVDPKSDTQIMPDVADELLGLALTSEDHDEYRSLVGRDSLSKEEIEVGKSGLNKAATDLLNEINVLGFAQGGVVNDMNRQMNLFSRGGLGDDGMQRDPVSGNEIPPGSLAEEVRDDIPAQLSEGEYVVPADVVRFFGVKYFEDLRAEAKMGLQGMEADGRIGGEPVGMPMAQASNPNEITEEDLAQLEQMLSTGVANGGLMDKIAIAAKTDKVINDRMNANGMVVGYAAGGEVTAPTASYADPTRVDAVINKVMVTLQQKPELVQELSKRGIQISRTNPSMQAGQMDQANPPSETRKAFAIGGMPTVPGYGMDTSYMTPTGLPSWASVPGSSYTYQGPGVPDATGQIPGAATPDTTPAVATNAADACKAMGMGYDPATGTCILVDSGDSGPTTTPEPAEFKWEEPDVNYFKMSEEELAAIGTGAKIDPFMNKLALGAAAVAGPLGLLIGGYNAYQQGKAISEVRSAALVAKARGFDDLAATLTKQADDLVGKSSFLVQGANNFGGLSGVNDFAQQIASNSKDVNLRLDPKDFGGLESPEYKRILEAMEIRLADTTSGGLNKVTPEMIKNQKTVEELNKTERPTTWTGGKVVSNQNKPSSNDKDSPAQAAAKNKAKAEAAAKKLGVGLATGGKYRGGLMKKRKKK